MTPDTLARVVQIAERRHAAPPRRWLVPLGFYAGAAALWLWALWRAWRG